MNRFKNCSLVFFRVVLGWMFFYAGITKVIDPQWTAAGYLESAHTFSGLYHWLASPAVIPVVNIVNEWGLVLLGVSLVIGIFVELSSWAGVVLMTLYYFPILQFPYPDPHSFIVDQHIIYIGALLVLSVYKAGTVWGIDSLIARSKRKELIM